MPLKLEGVSFSYRSNDGSSIPALRDVSLTINEGDFSGIMGHTGCGKTTLIQIMAGLLAPQSGRVLLDGEDINGKAYDKALLRRKLGLVFQFPEYQLFESTVEKDLAFGLKYAGLKGDEVKARTQWALETMGFSYENIRSLSPLSLSGGEKRRIAIAGVLVTKPGYLLLDEPLAGLDPAGCQSLLNTLARLNSEGTTVIMVSHNAEALGEYAGRLAVLDRAALVMEGPLKELFSDPLKLKALHLNAGGPREIAEMLSRRGLAIPAALTSYEELLGAIKSLLLHKGAAQPETPPGGTP